MKFLGIGLVLGVGLFVIVLFATPKGLGQSGGGTISSFDSNSQSGPPNNEGAGNGQPTESDSPDDGDLKSLNCSECPNHGSKIGKSTATKSFIRLLSR